MLGEGPIVISFMPRYVYVQALVKDVVDLGNNHVGADYGGRIGKKN